METGQLIKAENTQQQETEQTFITRPAVENRSEMEVTL